MFVLFVKTFFATVKFRIAFYTMNFLSSYVLTANSFKLYFKIYRRVFVYALITLSQFILNRFE